MKIEILQELESLKKKHPKRASNRPYSLPFKNRIIEMMKEGVDVVELSHESGVPMRTLHLWQQSRVEESFQKLHVTRSPAPLKIFLSEKVWLEVDESKLTTALLQKIRAAV